MSNQWHKLVCVSLFLLVTPSCGDGDEGSNVTCPVQCDSSGFSLACESGGLGGNNVNCATTYTYDASGAAHGSSNCSGTLTSAAGQTYQCTWTETSTKLTATCEGHGSCAYP